MVRVAENGPRLFIDNEMLIAAHVLIHEIVPLLIKQGDLSLLVRIERVVTVHFKFLLIDSICNRVVFLRSFVL